MNFSINKQIVDSINKCGYDIITSVELSFQKFRVSEILVFDSTILGEIKIKGQKKGDFEGFLPNQLKK